MGVYRYREAVTQTDHQHTFVAYLRTGSFATRSLGPPCGGLRRAAELSALYRAPNESLARQRHGTYKVGLKVSVLAQRGDTLLYNVSSRCAKWCYGTPRYRRVA